MATSAGANSATRPPICGSIRPAGCGTASMRCASAIGDAATTAWRASAGGRCSTSARVLLEVFLFDFSGRPLRTTIDVAFIDWIRPELKFDTVAELTRQMGADAQQARLALAARPGAFPQLGVLPAGAS